MKKLVFFATCIVALFSLLFVGCVTPKGTVSSQESEKIVVDDSLKVWTQDQLNGLKVRDSLYFYNDVEIKIEKILSEKQKFVKNHAIVSIDSTLKIFDVIPARTAGLIKNEPARGSNGIINALTVSFKRDSSTITMFFVRKGYLQQKDKVYVDEKGKEIRREKAPQVKNPECFAVDSTKIAIEYHKNEYIGKMLYGTKAVLLVVNKEQKGEREVNREAKSWNSDEKK